MWIVNQWYDNYCMTWQMLSKQAVPPACRLGCPTTFGTSQKLTGMSHQDCGMSHKLMGTSHKPAGMSQTNLWDIPQPQWDVPQADRDVPQASRDVPQPQWDVPDKAVGSPNQASPYFKPKSTFLKKHSNLNIDQQLDLSSASASQSAIVCTANDVITTDIMIKISS
jgi:hypothetical protein